MLLAESGKRLGHFAFCRTAIVNVDAVKEFQVLAFREFHEFVVALHAGKSGAIAAERVRSHEAVSPRVPRRFVGVRRMIEHGDTRDFAVGRTTVIVPRGDLPPEWQVVFRGCVRCLAIDADDYAIAVWAVQTKFIVDANAHRAFLRVAELDWESIRNQIDVEHEQPPRHCFGRGDRARFFENRHVIGGSPLVTRFDGATFRHRDFRANDTPVPACLGPEIDAMNALVGRFRLQFEAHGYDIAVAEPGRFLVEVVGRLADGAANHRPAAHDDRAVRRQ